LFNQVELDGYRELLRKIIVIKNSIADWLCEELSVINRSVKVVKDDLEVHAKWYSIDTGTVSDKDFESASTTKVIPPVDAILTATRTFDNGAEWVCMQVSFMKPNPAAGF
jgi:hypothetical protein